MCKNVSIVGASVTKIASYNVTPSCNTILNLIQFGYWKLMFYIFLGHPPNQYSNGSMKHIPMFTAWQFCR